MWASGIDIDWEYPGCSIAGERLPDLSDPDHDEGCPIWGTAREDADHFTALMTEMREAMDATFGKGVKKLDHINIMSYDMSGVWDGVTGHHTSFSDTKKVVDYFAGLGIDVGKLCIGTPFYALAFKMKEMNPMQVVGVPCEMYRASSGIVT